MEAILTLLIIIAIIIFFKIWNTPRGELPPPEMTGDPNVDSYARPQVHKLSSTFHIVMAVLSLLTVGFALPIWGLIGAFHYWLVYRPSAKKQLAWDLEYARQYTNINYPIV